MNFTNVYTHTPHDYGPSQTVSLATCTAYISLLNYIEAHHIIYYINQLLQCSLSCLKQKHGVHVEGHVISEMVGSDKVAQLSDKMCMYTANSTAESNKCHPQICTLPKQTAK